MIQITRLPEEVKRFLEPLRARFSYRHFLVFCWLIAAHLVCFEKATCKALGRYTPSTLAGGTCGDCWPAGVGRGRRCSTGW